MQTSHTLNFHHNFSEPQRLGDSNLFYDPVQVDRILTKILFEKEESYEASRKAYTTWR